MTKTRAARLPAAGLLLMGGRSRRLGQDKAMLPWPPGESGRLWEHQWATLNQLADPVWRAVAFGTSPGPDLLVDPEPWPGPLPAIAEALQLTPDWLIVLAVDLPLAGASLFHYLWSRRTAEAALVVPVAAGRRQPLAALWHRSALTAAKAALAAGDRRVLAALTGTRVVEVPLGAGEADWVRNINTPEDWDGLYNGR
jgi:molybdopterin-guanine dinucleotide biosynthesis protein A